MRTYQIQGGHSACLFLVLQKLLQQHINCFHYGALEHRKLAWKFAHSRWLNKDGNHAHDSPFLTLPLVVLTSVATWCLPYALSAVHLAFIHKYWRVQNCFAVKQILWERSNHKIFITKHFPTNNFRTVVISFYYNYCITQLSSSVICLFCFTYALKNSFFIHFFHY